MKKIKETIFRWLAGRLGGVLGRRNLVRVGGFLMRAGRQDMPNNMADNGEALVQQIVLEELAGSRAVMFDCGANIGQWATQLVITCKELGRRAPLRLFCFEPSSYSYTKLTAALSDLQTATLTLSTIQKAVSSKPGSMCLRIVHDGAGTNSLVAMPEEYASKELVIVTTLDEFAAENDIDAIDLLKIDTEGHDFDVILGAKSLLEEQRIGLVQFEYNWRWIYGKHFLQEAFDYLAQRGYSTGKITPQGIQFYTAYNFQLESFVEGNYLACTGKWKRVFKQVPSWLD